MEEGGCVSVGILMKNSPNEDEMERGKPIYRGHKHLPDLIPKIGKLNCPKKAEITRIESVKPSGVEGIWIRLPTPPL